MKMINNSLHENHIKNIEVKTIDGFQGREKDIIIISCVRSNNGVGFLNEMNRMIVCLTRAKHILIIVGNRKNLETDKLWKYIYCMLYFRNYLNYLSDRKYIIKMNTPNDCIITLNDSVKRKIEDEDVDNTKKKQARNF